MNDVITNWVASVLRHLLTGVTVWAVGTGAVTENQIANLILAIAGIAVSVGWAFVRQYTSEKEVDKALLLPAGTSKEALRK